jgi:LysR family transcriptional regulator for bpeEF and oprC
MDRLDALKVFCAVVDAGGFSRAADRLAISTSSVTNQVAALEAHFNIKLLHRTTRRMSVTDEGRQCYEMALALLGDMNELESSMLDSNQHPRGSLRVDMPNIISRLFVAPALPAFVAAYPDIRLRMTVGDRMIDMVEDGVDVLIRIGELPNSSLVAKTVLKTTYMCCASPAYLAGHGQPETPEQLSNFACLNFLYPKSHKVRPWMFEREGQQFPLTPRGVLDMDHVESLVEAAKAGCGIVQHLSLSVAEAIRSGALVQILPQWSAPGPDVSVLFHPRHHRAAKVKVFVDFIEQLFKPEMSTNGRSKHGRQTTKKPARGGLS